MKDGNLTYEKSGVSIKRGNDFIKKIQPIAEGTFTKEVVGGIGGFGGLFNISNFNVKNPVLVSATDGVGTKLLIAQEVKKHDTIGQDLVAMCVNDIITHGATPLFFLDYIATGKIDPDALSQVVKGIADGCKKSEMALIGGETAEMPGMYNNSAYDIAGFCVGIVDKEKIIPMQDKMKNGDIILGIASNGIHSNGLSLARKILEKNGINYDDKFYTYKHTWADILLLPTKIYTQPVLAIRHLVNGFAHVTGGGLYENLSRIFPEHLTYEIIESPWLNSESSWIVPDIFKALKELGNISNEEMNSTFNCGIGMLAIVPEKNLSHVSQILNSHNELTFHIGTVIESK